jgi:guanine deaminase
MRNDEFMKLAVDLALQNVLSKSGGPFGAVVVKNGRIIGLGRNQVTTLKDPTAHAEIQAIRASCLHLNSYQLTDCEIYTNSEPCPMCLGAIYWSRLKAIYYASTVEDAAKIGFEDQHIYQQFALPKDERTIPMTQILTPNYQAPFQLWQQTSQKKNY